GRPGGWNARAVLAKQPADAATEGQAADADRSRVAERGGEPMGRRGDRVLAGRQAGLRPRDPAVRVDVQTLHRAEIEDDATLVRGVAGEAVAAAADGQLETGLPGQRDGPGDVRRIGGADDQGGAPVAVRVVDLASLVVVRAARQDDGSGEAGFEGFEVECVDGLGTGLKGFHDGLLEGCVREGDVPRWSSRAPL